MLARALLRMICNMLLLLHMLPFTVRYSVASVLVVIVAASSNGWPCRKQAALVLKRCSKHLARALVVESAFAAWHAALHCQVLTGQGLGGHCCCFQQWLALHKALNSSEMSCGQKMQHIFDKGYCSVKRSCCLTCCPPLLGTRWPESWWSLLLRPTVVGPAESSQVLC